MIILLLSILIFSALISFIKSEGIDNAKLIIFCIIGLFLFLLATFADENSLKDRASYIYLYNNVDSGVIDPSFIYLSKFVKCTFGNVLFVFSIYAFLGVFLKFFSIYKLSNLPFLSVTLYASYFYILFELTTIRAGVSAAFILLAIQPIYSRNLKIFLLFAITAIFFHISALIVLPLWFLKSDKIKPLNYVALICFGYFLFFLKIDIIESIVNLIPIEMVKIRYSNLKMMQDSPMSDINVINVFNKLFLLRCFLYFVLLFKSRVLIDKNKYSYLLLKIYGISLAAFVIFSSMPIFGARLSELLGIVEIITIPLFYYIIKPKILGKILIIVYAVSTMLLIVFYNKVVT